MSRYNQEMYRRIWGESPPQEALERSAAHRHPEGGEPLAPQPPPGEAHLDHVFSARLARIESALDQILGRLTAIEAGTDKVSDLRQDPYESPPQH